jgi:hypothetical protein
MPFEGEGFASIPEKNLAPPAPLGSDGPVSRSNHQLSLSCEKICVASKNDKPQKIHQNLCLCPSSYLLLNYYRPPPLPASHKNNFHYY